MQNETSMFLVFVFRSMTHVMYW